MNDLIQTLPYYEEEINTRTYKGEEITINDTLTCDSINTIIKGKTRFERSDGSFTDVWEEGVELKSVGEKENNILVYTENSSTKRYDKIIPLSEPLKLEDYFKEENGTLKLYKMSRKYTFTGDENFIRRNLVIENNTIGFGISKNDLTFFKEIGKGICDKFPFESSPDDFWNRKDVKSFTITDFIQFRIPKSELTTQDVAGFKVWLKSNPTTVVCELENPVITDISDFDINIPMHYGDEFISTDNEIKPILAFDLPYLKPKHSLLNMYYDNKGFMEEFGGFILEGTEFPIVEENIEDVEVEGNPMGTLTQKTGGYKDLIFNPTVRIIGSDWRNKTRQIANWLQGGKGKIFFSNDVTKSAIVKRVSFSSPTFQANSYTEIELTIVCEPFYYNTEQEEITWNNGETKYIDTDIPCTPVIESSTAGAKTNIIFNEVHFSVLNASEDFIVDCTRGIIQEKISKKFLAYEGDMPVINNGNNKMGAGVNSIKVIVNERYRG